MTDTILSITDLDVRGRPPGGTYVPIVTGVSLSVKKGEVLALIGESGSGTVLASSFIGRKHHKTLWFGVFYNSRANYNLAIQ